jgi:hypothetical protein
LKKKNLFKMVRLLSLPNFSNHTTARYVGTLSRIATKEKSTAAILAALESIL